MMDAMENDLEYVPSLCNDAGAYVISFWWPSAIDLWWGCVSPMLTPRTREQWRNSASRLCPHTFEQRLRATGPMIRAIAGAARVSPTWRRHVEAHAWTAVAEFLYARPAKKADLQKWYGTSMRELLTKDWLQIRSRQSASGSGPNPRLRRQLAELILAYV
eukprot:gnl/TRDRNA2_/TRDRNA2_195859_c0_seq1.p1 gnl/TRDRNA2_/TRDRNA2_195859_c0~~gnl/TRDRNA2_/TRDRNA2_195859_c0_seq1.p1  ORF type:complete len:160 (+),score=18.04 gnl/TRDRNA2_/TRDRNA2_195859_c0_seq1:104-583(+)